MIVLEYKIKAKQYQYQAIDEAIRTGQFVRNKALRYWMDNKGVNKYDLNKYCRVIAKEYSFGGLRSKRTNNNAKAVIYTQQWFQASYFVKFCIIKSVPVRL